VGENAVKYMCNILLVFSFLVRIYELGRNTSNYIGKKILEWSRNWHGKGRGTARVIGTEVGNEEKEFWEEMGEYIWFFPDEAAIQCIYL
jgi:hypothetical protein